MADTWYCGRDKKKFGPFTSAQLKQLADAGKLRATDTVWKEGVEQGVPAVKVKGLFAQAPAPAAPTSAPAEEGAAPGGATAEEPAPVGAPAPDAADEVETAEHKAEGAGAVEQSTDTSPESEPPPKQAPPPTQETRKGRIISIKGGVLSSQDGVMFRFRKKCEQCGYGDTAMTTMRIRSGIMRADFFCRKCRKSRPVEIYGVI